VGLIPCARGGSNIGEWQRSTDLRTLYGSCLHRAQVASSKGHVAGVLFYQGEAEGSSAPEAPHAFDWATYFTRFVGDLRADLQAPGLPLIFARIGHTTTEQSATWQAVRAQQGSIRLPNVVMVDTDDLSLVDYVHLSTDSQTALGQRFAQAYADLALRSVS
jgi:hypothetical protein